MLYVPFIQDFAKDIALREVKKSTGMDITVGFLRLRFPLRVSLDDVVVLQPDEPDTMATLGSAALSVKVLPLLRGQIKIGGIDISNVSYSQGTPDSAMCLRARIEKFHIDDGNYGLKDSRIDLGATLLDGADISLSMRDTITPEKADTAAPSPLSIAASRIELRNVRFRMQMLPAIDTLTAYIPEAQLRDGLVDMRRHVIKVHSLAIDSADVAYLTPSAKWLREHPAKAKSDSTKSASEPWTVTAGELSFTGRRLTYATSGVRPMRGFDASYIEVTDAVLRVDSFYNRGTDVTVPLRRLEARERCGLALSASGTFSMDSTAMHASAFTIKAGNSGADINASLGMGEHTAPSTPLTLLANARISVADIETAFPQMAKTLRGIPRSPISITADIDGTMGAIDVNTVRIDWPSYLKLQARGHIDSPMDMNRMRGQVTFDGTLRRLDFLKPTLLTAAMAKQINLPASTIKGHVDYRPGAIAGNVTLATAPGVMAAQGRWLQTAKGYEAHAELRNFPVQAYMPSLGPADVTANISVKGQGLDFYSPRTHADADINLSHLRWKGRTYSDISLQASLADGQADAEIISHNPGADLDADLTATLSDDECKWELSADISRLDLHALGFTQEAMNGSGIIASTGTFHPRSKAIDATLDLSQIDWNMGEQPVKIASLNAFFATNDSLTHLNVESGDLNLTARAFEGLTPLMKQISGLTPLIDTIMSRKRLDVISLQRHLPPMNISLSAGNRNPAADFLARSKIKWKSLTVNANNDSLMSMHMRTTGFSKGTTRLDSLSLDLNQHGKYLLYNVKLDNKPGTLDDFAHVLMRGFVADDKLAFLIDQHNIEGKQGFNIGLTAAFTDSLVSLRVVPRQPMIAYQPWRVNSENRIIYNFLTHHVDANLKLTNGQSTVHLYTDSAATDPGRQKDLIVKLTDIQLADWLSISPFAPPIKGALAADLRLRTIKNGIAGKGNVSLSDLYYGRDRVGTFDLNLDVSNDRSGALRADVALLVDSIEVMTAQGALNDSTLSNPFLLDFSMIHFPLRVANPFLPKNVAQLSGMLNGRMKISGSLTEPRFNGYLDFDSTAVKVGMTGVSYRFSEEKIPVDSNIVTFKDFTISGLNSNPLSVNGTVDLRHISNIGIDLSMNARDMLIVNSSRARGADIYGKGLIDLDATAKGNLQLLRVNAAVALLPESNVTYVMTSAPAALGSRNNGHMVQFVQFSDTTGVAADSVANTSLALVLNADIEVQEGSTINVDISTDGKNKASIKGFGQLNYSLNPMNDGRLVGRFTINSGFVRYTPPLMSEKNFKFREGSYINFTGNMLNPSLNLQAVDELKANVTQEGQNSRLVNFLVKISVSQTLQNLNVAFDLSTNDDITVENELTAMSPEQRANQAMNLLIYNVYTGPGTKASSNLSGNPLFSFLENQINTWAANNIRGVDISFGIDQYDKTTDGTSQTTTSYSYRVSKTLFNNRFKIVVGGNYSTDANTDENLSQNLINDISFEYMLNRSGSMYVRLFRHVGFESILEGEVTQTGVGFVYRHKLNSLRDLFRWRRTKNTTNTTVTTP